MTRSRAIFRLAVVAVTMVASVVLVGQLSVAEAGSKTATLSVTASVGANCSISTSPVAFGTYDVLAVAALDATGTVTITCAKGTTTTIGLNLGVNFLGTQRRMLDGTPNYLDYELYSDAGRTTVWGNSAPAWYTPAAAPDKNARTFTVYGRVPAGQDIPAADYVDSVIATVNY